MPCPKLGCASLFFWNGKTILVEANQHKGHNEKLQKKKESKGKDAKNPKTTAQS